MNGLFILGIILFIVAFIFIGIEMIIPGFGAPGIIGCCCLVAGVSLTANTYTQAIMIIAIIPQLITWSIIQDTVDNPIYQLSNLIITITTIPLKS